MTAKEPIKASYCCPSKKFDIAAGGTEEAAFEAIVAPVPPTATFWAASAVP